MSTATPPRTSTPARGPVAEPSANRRPKLRGRPELFTRYQDDQAPLGTPAKRFWIGRAADRPRGRAGLSSNATSSR